jgi:hypothetical protein
MSHFTPLPRRRGRIDYLSNKDRARWGFEEWTITRGTDGMRLLNVHCELRFNDEHVARDSMLSVDADWQPVESYVRIMNQGRMTGTGWFRFADDHAECESWSEGDGRISQRIPITRPMRGFGIHAVQSDGWMTASFPWDMGAGHTHFWPTSLLHSLHHFGATGPSLHPSTSGLRFEGEEEVEVPAGRFACRRVSFAAMTNNHPPYDMWISTDGDCLYVKGVVQGYMDSIFELAELEGEPLA